MLKKILFEKENFFSLAAFTLFTLSGILAIVSNLPWFSQSLKQVCEYRNAYHMISSIQGSLSCLCAAFCFIWISRLSGIPSVGRLSAFIVFFASIGTTLTAWHRYAVPDEFMLAASVVFWSILLAVIIISVYPFLSKSKKFDLPKSLIWLPIALIFGLTGETLVSTYSSLIVVLEKNVVWLVNMGRGYLLQAMILSLILGVAPIILPRYTKRNENTIIFGKKIHITTALLLTVSFPIEFMVSYHAGLFLRGLTILLFLIISSGLSGRPLNSWLAYTILCSAWLIPAGYITASFTPLLRTAGLHIVFIGGFTMGPMALAPFLMPNIKPEAGKSLDRLPALGIFSGLMLLSMVLRMPAELNENLREFWLAGSTVTFIAGMFMWIFLVFRAYQSGRK